MEENNILNKKNKKKILVGSIVIVLVLILVVITSTYAYFSLQVNGEGTSTKVTITTGSNNQIKLSGGLEDFHIKLEVKDMAYNRQNWEYYATDNKDLNYVINKENGLKEIGKVEVIGELEERQVCTAKAKVNLGGDMKEEIKEGDLEISLENGMYTSTSDLTKIKDSLLTELEFVIIDTSTHNIQAYLKFKNRDEEQNYLAGKTLNVNIIIDEFECNTDNTIPVVSNFYFDENEGKEQKYTNEIKHTLHLSWEDSDVTEYCINKNNTTEGCEWNKTNGSQSIEKEIELDNTEGEQKYYGYIKDKIGNISIGVTASIIYDNITPVLNNFYIKEEGSPKYTNNQTNKVYFQYSDNNIKDICITEEQTTERCDWKTISNSNNIDYIFTNNTEGPKTIYGYVRDKAGNISNTQLSDTITYDVTPPTVTYSPGQGTYTGEQKITITVDDSLSGVGNWGVNVTKDGVIDSTKSNTDLAGQTSFTVNLEEGSTWTVYAIVYDNAGNRQSTQPVTTEGWYYQTYTIQSNGGENLKTLQSTSGDYLKEAYSGDELLRYIGKYSEITNNYICFGTIDIGTCTSNPDTYMYRIIGITTENVNRELELVPNQLKIIKATPLKEGSMWSESGNNWDNTNNTVRPYLNTTFLGTIASNWQGIISDPKWYIGDNKSADSTTTEVKTPSTGKYKVGLMYASDYYNSWTYATNKDSWLHITHGITGGRSTNEWTMTGYGRESYNFRAWMVVTGGTLYASYQYNGSAVRPVFYLSSNIKLSGSGIESSPFIITFTR